MRRGGYTASEGSNPSPSAKFIWRKMEAKVYSCEFCDKTFKGEEVKSDDGYNNLNECNRCGKKVCNDCESVIWGDSCCYTCGPNLRSCPDCEDIMQESWAAAVKEIGEIGTGDYAMDKFTGRI